MGSVLEGRRPRRALSVHRREFVSPSHLFDRPTANPLIARYEAQADSAMDAHVVAAAAGDEHSGSVVAMAHSVRRMASILKALRTVTDRDMTTLKKRSEELAALLAQAPLRHTG